MEQRLNIVTLGVQDLKESTDFYEQKFGWKRLQMGGDGIAFFKLNGLMLALYPNDKLAEDATVQNGEKEAPRFKGFTIAYNARSEKEVDDIVTDLERKGVKIVKRPVKVFWGGYSAYISDPDGHLWEIAYNPFLELDAEGNIS
eukprot:gb/GECG01014333.1/.p1 GENE.gb/GECG01014333.1/~~gb/GECG01014333.1/.p1  ORF type:complete len:143 (+),score=25.68 gb/GECG01014333.1/:1-429(+)